MELDLEQLLAERIFLRHAAQVVAAVFRKDHEESRSLNDAFDFGHRVVRNSLRFQRVERRRQRTDGLLECRVDHLI